MKEKTVEKAISATRRNYNFGTAVISGIPETAVL